MNAGVETIDVAIIGAGTAGLAARAEVAKVTDSYRVFDPGPYGTTCARSACMPSKAFLQSAHDFHRRKVFRDLGIAGANALKADPPRVLAETRRVRDGLVEGVIETMEDWRETHLVAETAAFDRDGILRAGRRGFRPRATVVASGSRPVVPEDWRKRCGDRILTTDRFFELDTLPRRVAVVGLGPVGLELGQAMARLGVEVTGFDPSPAIGGLADDELQTRLREAIRDEMTIVQAEAEPAPAPGGAIRMHWPDGEVEVDCVLAAMGRKPELTGLGLEALGIELGDKGQPEMPDGQLNPEGTRVYFAATPERMAAALAALAWLAFFGFRPEPLTTTPPEETVTPAAEPSAPTDTALPETTPEGSPETTQVETAPGGTASGDDGATTEGAAEPEAPASGAGETTSPQTGATEPAGTETGSDQPEGTQTE